MSEYKDIFGYRMTFGPDDHKGVDESVLMMVQDGRWVLLEESISYQRQVANYGTLRDI